MRTLVYKNNAYYSTIECKAKQRYHHNVNICSANVPNYACSGKQITLRKATKNEVNTKRRRRSRRKTYSNWHDWCRCKCYFKRNRLSRKDQNLCLQFSPVSFQFCNSIELFLWPSATNQRNKINFNTISCLDMSDQFMCASANGASDDVSIARSVGLHVLGVRNVRKIHTFAFKMPAEPNK